MGTATLQSFQSLTGTIGLSIMGLILNSNFSARLTHVVPAGLTDYVAQEELAPYLSANALVDAAGTNEFMNSLPQEAQGLFATMIDNVNSAYAGSLRVVFIVLLCLLVVAFLSMLLLKEKKPAQA